MLEFRVKSEYGQVLRRSFKLGRIIEVSENPDKTANIVVFSRTSERGFMKENLNVVETYDEVMEALRIKREEVVEFNEKFNERFENAISGEIGQLNRRK